jgi:hypothetical protein
MSGPLARIDVAACVDLAADAFLPNPAVILAAEKISSI